MDFLATALTAILAGLAAALVLRSPSLGLSVALFYANAAVILAGTSASSAEGMGQVPRVSHMYIDILSTHRSNLLAVPTDRMIARNQAWPGWQQRCLEASLVALGALIVKQLFSSEGCVGISMISRSITTAEARTLDVWTGPSCLGKHRSCVFMLAQ